MPAGRGYDLVYRASAAADPRIQTLEDWLEEEVLAFTTDPETR